MDWRTCGRCSMMALLMSCLLAWPAASEAQNGIVSTAWLSENLGKPHLVLLDIRKVEDYREGHVPSAVSAYYGSWAYRKDEKYTEVPYTDDLFDQIGELGITPASKVVIICKTSECHYQVQSARVACTLQLAGIDRIAILDGGHDKWRREKRAETQTAVKPVRTPYKGKLRRDLFADKAHVIERFPKILFIDVRETVLYSGEKKQPFMARSGHIPGSVNLPASHAFAVDGTFKPREELDRIARGITGGDKSREIVTYCDTGRCCPTWAFLLRSVLGYRNVRLYDGSFEEWSKDTTLPVTKGGKP